MATDDTDRARHSGRRDHGPEGAHGRRGLGPACALDRAGNGRRAYGQRDSLVVFPRSAGKLGSTPYLDTVDPGGRIAAALGPERAVGCVVYVGANIPEPGVVEHNNGGTYIVGEPDGSESARARNVVDFLLRGGLEGILSADIRRDVWTKLWGNLSGNPMSVLCQANCEQLAQDAEVCGIMGDMMTEAGRVAMASGCDITPDVAERLDTFKKLGTIKTSMLQDFEAGKAIELDALLGVICELGRRGAVETPTCDMIYALTRLKARAAGCYEPVS